MGRLVEAPRLESLSRGRGGGGLEGLERGGGDEKVAVGGDDFLGRVVKYVPTEILAAYGTLDNALFSRPPLPRLAGTDGGQSAKITALESIKSTDWSRPLDFTDPQLAIFLFLICLILAPLYIVFQARQARSGTPWVAHACMAFIGFFIWAYFMKSGVFLHHTEYNGKLATILMVCFSLLCGIVKPRPRGEADNDADVSAVAPPRRGGVAT